MNLAAFMFITTIAALVFLINRYYFMQNWILFSVGVFLLVLALGVGFLAVNFLKKKHVFKLAWPSR